MTVKKQTDYMEIYAGECVVLSEVEETDADNARKAQRLLWKIMSSFPLLTLFSAAL
jgi:hypothetical protein